MSWKTSKWPIEFWPPRFTMTGFGLAVIYLTHHYYHKSWKGCQKHLHWNCNVKLASSFLLFQIRVAMARVRLPIFTKLQLLKNTLATVGKLVFAFLFQEQTFDIEAVTSPAGVQVKKQRRLYGNKTDKTNSRSVPSFSQSRTPCSPCPPPFPTWRPNLL